MAQLLVRDVPEEMVAALEARAKANGCSAEAEPRAILVAALGRLKNPNFWAEADRLRKELQDQGRIFDSTEILRQECDRR